MNTIQQIRRFSQGLMATGWGKALEHHNFQFPIIKRLYRFNGLELVNTCEACPEQYNVFKDGKQVAYLRLRHGQFRVDSPECGDNTIYEHEPDGDGMFQPYERLVQLTKALRSINLYLSLTAEPETQDINPPLHS